MGSLDAGVSALDAGGLLVSAPEPSWIPSYVVSLQLFGILVYVLVVTVQLGYPREYVVIKTQEVKREKKRWPVCLGHALIFYLLRPACCFFGRPGMHLYERFLRWFTTHHNSWDKPYRNAKAAQRQVLLWCRFWGVQVEPWVWDRQPGGYTSKNDFFTRTYSKEWMPKMGSSQVVSPVDGVCTWFACTRDMPKRLKNDAFWDLSSIGIPDSDRYEKNPACMLYLAPNDYHCFHAPVTGRVVHCEMFPDFWSGTVKSDIWGSVNILAQHRRVVVVFEVRSPTASSASGSRSSLMLSPRASHSRRRLGSRKTETGSRQSVQTVCSTDDQEEAAKNAEEAVADDGESATETPLPSASPSGSSVISDETATQSCEGSPARDCRTASVSAAAVLFPSARGRADGEAPETIGPDPGEEKIIRSSSVSPETENAGREKEDRHKVHSEEANRSSLKARGPTTSTVSSSSRASMRRARSFSTPTAKGALENTFAGELSPESDRQARGMPTREYVAMVIVGGITVDSIRMDIPCKKAAVDRYGKRRHQADEDEDWLHTCGSDIDPTASGAVDELSSDETTDEDESPSQDGVGPKQVSGSASSLLSPSKRRRQQQPYVRKGDKIGCFARGGSLVAMFFSRPVQLQSHIAATRKQFNNIDFKLNFGESLGTMVV
ncbi:unnamed protein product [Amoebophrya sp. A25]|nr:unnamed protein product [Amoebophrya sp. A25]|eukprot:GSA25T00015936001.1